MAVVVLGAAPEEVDLAIYRGDDFTVTFFFVDSDGDSVDLTDYTFAADIKLTPQSAEAVVSFSTDFQTPNAVSITLTAEETADARTGHWDLQLTDGDGLVTTPVYGRVRVTRDITE